MPYPVQTPSAKMFHACKMTQPPIRHIWLMSTIPYRELGIGQSKSDPCLDYDDRIWRHKINQPLML